MKNAAGFGRGTALVLGACWFGAGCNPVTSSAPSAPVGKAAPVHTDIAGLSKMIALPRKPIAVMWQQTQIGDGVMGPSDLQLLAVLTFSPADADKVEATARKHGTAQGSEELLAQSWFPSPVRQSAVRGASGHMIIAGPKWKPDDFGKMSLTNGFVMRVGKTNFFVLSLYTT